MRSISVNDLRDMDVRGLDRIYLHWTAGRYEGTFPDYHINITGDGGVYLSSPLRTTLAHTWRRNTGAIGITLCCAYNATPDDLGQYPPTNVQVETMAQIVAVLCGMMGVPITSDHVLTHAEAADLDEYGPATTCERWDLWKLKTEDEGGSGGDILRGKAIWYQNHGY